MNVPVFILLMYFIYLNQRCKSISRSGTVQCYCIVLIWSRTVLSQPVTVFILEIRAWF